MPFALLALPTLLGQGKRLRYLCQDETRVGLKTGTGKVITAPGVKPMGPVQWGRENFWIYGVVEPMSGWQFEREYDPLDSQNLQGFLNELACALGEDRAVLQMDQAQAHRALALAWSEQVIPLFQPASSPELNPIERLWLFVKRQIQGENFATLTQLRLRLSQVFEQLAGEQVASLTSYPFILEALLYAASN